MVMDRGEEDIVITGVSGRFPQTNNIEEFWTALISGKDLVTEDDTRWPAGYRGVPRRKGVLTVDLRKYDAEYFSDGPRFADDLEPLARQLHEVTYEAILDSGYRPQEIRGTSTGVFLGNSSYDSLEMTRTDPDRITNLAAIGNFPCLLPNRVSFKFDLRGPSYMLDTYCSSSMLAIHNAVESMRAGSCSGAIVAGTNLLLSPLLAHQLNICEITSSDGKCKSFDDSADGYARSDSIVAVFLQKRKDARRVYGAIVHSRSSSDGFKSRGPGYPSGEAQADLIRETYKVAGIDPKDVAYIEPHATGTLVGDPQEINAIDAVFSPGRDPSKNPVLIGTVKSNMGHSEAAAGLCALTKLVLSFQNGVIPPNLHYQTPNRNIPGLIDGRIKVCTTPTNIQSGLFAMNCFGIGGTNVHIILKNEAQSLEQKPSKLRAQHENAISSGLPSIIPFSGRTAESVSSALTKILGKTSETFDPEYFGLLQKLAETEDQKHIYRGYAMVDPNKPGRAICRVIKSLPIEKQSIWIIFPGTGSQSIGVVRELMGFQVFAASVHRSELILKTVGQNLQEILNSPEETVFQRHMNLHLIVVGIGLIDLLHSLALRPDGMIGHSGGELLCAYADGCLTQEEVVLLNYYKELAVNECKGGLMASVGLSMPEVLSRLSSYSEWGVVAACHNAERNVTVSGQAEGVTSLVTSLKAQGVFVTMIPTSGVAYHSPMLVPCVDSFVRMMRSNAVLKTRVRIRSTRWISTSVPQGEWSTDLAGSASLEYFENNMKGQVHFRDALRLVPGNATLLEVGAKSIFKSIVSRLVPPTCSYLGLLNGSTVRTKSTQLVSALGELYLLGFNPAWTNLYPKLEFPVSLGTPSISPLVQWDHSETYSLPDYLHAAKNTGESCLRLSLSHQELSFLEGHVLNGHIVLPGVAFLLMVWNKFAHRLGKVFDEVPVRFSNVYFQRPVIISKDADVNLLITLLEHNGEFFIREGEVIVAGGFIHELESDWTQDLDFLSKSPLPTHAIDSVKYVPGYLNSDDFYKELRLRGYQYSGLFKSVLLADTQGSWSQVRWTDDNWISFLDSMLQLLLLPMSRRLNVPTTVTQVILHPLKFKESLQNNDGLPILVHRNFNEEDQIACSGILCSGVNCRELTEVTIPGSELHNVSLHSTRFVPFDNDLDEDVGLRDTEVLRVCLQLCLENSVTFPLDILEGPSGIASSDMAELMKEAETLGQGLGQLTLVLSDTQKPSCTEEVPNDLEETGENNKIHVVYEAEVSNIDTKFGLVLLSDDNNNNSETSNLVDSSGFLLLRSNMGSGGLQGQNGTHPGWNLISKLRSTSGTRYKLFQRIQNMPTLEEKPHVILLKPDPTDISWLPLLQELMRDPSSTKHIYLTSVKDPRSGVIGLVKCLRREPGGQRIRALLSEDKTLEVKESIDWSTYPFKAVLQKNLVFNVVDPQGQLGFFANFPYATPLPNEKPVEPTSGILKAHNNEICPSSLLQWLEGNPYEEHQEISSKRYLDVYSVSLNVRRERRSSGGSKNGSLDCRKVRGQSPTSTPSHPDESIQQEHLIEFVGRDQGGKMFMGLAESKELVNTRTPFNRVACLFPVPKNWSIEEACSALLSYSTAYYALRVRGGVPMGSSVLIHSGSEAISQAAISIVLSLGCSPVFVTVASKEHRKWLLQDYPQLKRDNILTMKDSSNLKTLVAQETRGHGVDTVLNPSSNLQLSLECISGGGSLIEFHQVDLKEYCPYLGSQLLSRDLTLHAVNLDTIIFPNGNGSSSPKSRRQKAEVLRLVEEGLGHGVVKPIRRQVFHHSQVSEALRASWDPNGYGKVLIQLRRAENDLDSPEKCSIPRSMNLVQLTYFDPWKVYLIVGGLGGFGLELTDWMVGRGAKKIVLVSRTGVTKGYQDLHLRRWRKAGAHVEVSKVDLTQMALVEPFFRQFNGTPVGGIFQLAMVLRDGLLESQTELNFQEVIQSKLIITQVLDSISRALCPKLEYFVLFSSISSGQGNGGQGPYGYGNSGAERIIEARFRDGFPALAIQWGPVGDVGRFWDDQFCGGVKERSILGTMPQRISSCLRTLDMFLRNGRSRGPIVGSAIYHTPNPSSEKKLTLIQSVCRAMGLTPPGASVPKRVGEIFNFGVDSLLAVEIKLLLDKWTNECKGMSLSDLRKITWEDLDRLELECQ